ncbi:MAG: AAA family ATPase [Candidatus Promineifilaceae bacterium]|nr:AAA family ATPase [Candidatus Promineifilaceae bacterium]
MVTATEAPIRIFMLGRFEISRDDQVLNNAGWSRRKAARLLQRLAIERQLHKEQAIEFLWPGSDPEAGANNLYRTLYALRQTLDERLGDGAAEATFAFQKGILNLDDDVWVDAHAFKRLCSQAATGEEGGDRTRLEEALKLYDGDLLPDERYAEWTFTHRDQLRRYYRETILALAAHLREDEAYDGAIELLSSFLADEPVDEPAHRELIRVYALAGRRHDALRQYQSCVDALADELGVPPGPETEALHAQVLSGELVASPASQPETWTPPTPLVPTIEQGSPLVGREREVETVRAWLQSAWEGEGQTILVAGDTGVGKTRLAYEALRTAADEGMTTLWGSAYEQEEQLPYQPFTEAFDRYLGEHDHVTGKNPITDFKRLVSDSRQRGQWALFNTAATFLTDLCNAHTEDNGDRSPVVLFLDDLHAADEASLHLFQYLARQTRRAPVILLATYRSDIPTSGTPFDTLLTTLYRERLSETLALAPLGERAIGKLMADTLGGDVAPALIEAVHDVTGGNPFYIEEITQALMKNERIDERDGQWQLKPDEALDIPAGLGGLLNERVASLGQRVKQALSTAAVIGREFDFDVLRSAVELPPGELLDALDLTLAGRLLEETETGYRFRHPLIRRVLYDSLSRARRAWLHGETAEAIETVYGRRPAGLDPYVEELAFHYEHSDRRDRALDYLIQAGRKAASLYAFEVAVNDYERALKLLDEVGPPDPERRFWLLESIGKYHGVLADTPEAVVAYNRALDVAGDDGWQPEPTDRARLHRRAAMALITAGQMDSADEHLQAAMAELGGGEDTRELAYVLYNLAQLHWHRNEYQEAFDVAQRSLGVAERVNHQPAIARAFEMLALACHSLGEWQQGLQFEEQRAALAGSDLDVSDAFDVHL